MARLTEEMVIARSKQSDLGSIKKLNCWGSDLSDVSIIRRMAGVEVLALSVNKISSMSAFEECKNLQELYLRKNNIKDLNEIAYLQSLPNLKYLWLDENPCVDSAGPGYRAIVLRALPNLKKLDNIDVTEEEVQDALRNAVQRDDDVYSDTIEKQQFNQNSANHIQNQHNIQQRRSQSPIKQQIHHHSFENTEECISDPITQGSIPSSPFERTPSHQDFSPAESAHPPSPKYVKDNRNSYHQYDRSPGSDQDSPVNVGYRERAQLPPSISTHSMKEYYQSDCQRSAHPIHYRHSQTDLTEWDDQQNQCNGSNNSQRRSAGTEKENLGDRFGYRNGNLSREKEEWDENERPRRDRRLDRFNDSASVVSSAVLNHYAGYHRRPVNRSSNLLSATLCLVKELDYPSLEVVEHAVRCRIDELSAE